MKPFQPLRQVGIWSSEAQRIIFRNMGPLKKPSFPHQYIEVNSLIKANIRTPSLQGSQTLTNAHSAEE